MYKILFIDTITTGMNPEKCAIYRMGGIFTENGKETKRFELKMRPFMNARISDQSLWIGGETRSSLIRYPDQAEAFKDFINLLEEQVDISNPYDKIYIGGFNSDRFEYPFLREWFRRNGNERFRDYFYVQTFDMMSAATFALFETRRSLPDFCLDTAARKLGLNVPADDKYNCIMNAEICLSMFRLLASKWGITECNETGVAEVIFRNF